METRNHRKLLQIYNQVADFTAPSRIHNEPISTVQNATSASPESKSRSPLDSSMALTVVVLMAALVFMSFFSIYIRRFADDSTAGNTSDSGIRRRSNGHNNNNVERRGRSDSRKGLDPEAVKSLPVRRYGQEANARFGDCPICLTEFEEGESVKVMPGCTHAFHAPCVDTWLSSHVTCPVCRNTRLTVDGYDTGGKSTAEDNDTSMDVESAGAVRRDGGSRLAERRIELPRTRSV